MAIQTINVPDIGGAENVDIIEVFVAVGDVVGEDDSLIVVETDKSSMEIPTPVAGTIVKVLVAEGSTISEGGAMVEIEVEGAASTEEAPKEAAAEPQSSTSEPAQEVASGGTQVVDIVVPDIGDGSAVVIELCAASGDDVGEGDSLIVLETDKASMEIPAEFAGKVVTLTVKEDDQVSTGDVIGTIEVQGSASAPAPQAAAPAAEVAVAVAPSTPAPAAKPAAVEVSVSATSGSVHAGPAVRKLARQMGVDLSEVKSTGPKSRIIKDDVRSFVKSVMQTRTKGGSSASGSGIPPVPAVDFSKFGEVEMLKMSKIKKITAANMTRNWLNVPHVTQFDDVDITEMEAFRKGMKADAEKAGVKLTPIPFLLKACAAALKAEPSFNVSMHEDGEHIVQKKYIHIGVAVNTPNGLMVPVIRDVDKKGLFQLAEEFMVLVKKARDGKLMPADMQGGCFTISSLGAIGGTGFTPIVNAPEVAILGVSRADTKPVWNGKEFEPKLMMPLCLSYDHRAINGVDAGMFFTYLNSVLKDVRRLLL